VTPQIDVVHISAAITRAVAFRFICPPKTLPVVMMLESATVFSARGMVE